MFRVQMCFPGTYVGPLPDPKGHDEPSSCDEQKCVVMYFLRVNSREMEADASHGEPQAKVAVAISAKECSVTRDHQVARVNSIIFHILFFINIFNL